jgi:CRP-like cAMP-binding protein
MIYAIVSLSPITPLRRHRRLRDPTRSRLRAKGGCDMASRSNLQPFLERLTSRSVLSERERGRILSLPFRARQTRPNTDFVALGERVAHACYIVDGLVGRFDESSNGARQITALHIAGDMADLHSVVQPTATSALQALSATTILEIPHAALRSAAADHPAIAEAFWRDCMVDSMILAQWVVNVGRRDALSRLAHLLCEMACRYKRAPVNGRVSFVLEATQAQLADANGMTPVHVNRTLRKLAQIGTFVRSRRVVIEDWDALVETGDFDRQYLQDNLESCERLRIVN